MKKLHLLTLIAVLAAVFTSVQGSYAQQATGGLAVNPYNGYDLGSTTGSSFTLATENTAAAPGTGTFADINLVASNHMAISGLTLGQPMTVSISNFLVLMDYDTTTLFPVTGSDILTVNLTQVTETSYNSTLGLASYSITGVMTDNMGQITQNSPIAATIGFSGPSNYSFTIAAVPEPSSLMMELVSMGCFGILIYARRQFSN